MNRTKLILISALALFIMPTHPIANGDIDSTPCFETLYTPPIVAENFWVYIYYPDKCDCNFGDISRNGYMIIRSAGFGTGFVLYGAWADLETRLTFTKIHIDGDTIPELLVMETNIDNTYGSIHRLIIKNDIFIGLQTVHLPNIIEYNLEERRPYIITSDSSFLWLGSKDTPQDYHIYYDKLGDSLAIGPSKSK